MWLPFITLIMKKIIVLLALFQFTWMGCQTKIAPTMVEDRFPTLKAQLLSGPKVVFPDFLKGKKTLIAMVYEKGGAYIKPQNQALKWQDFWATELGPMGIDFYEIPMMDGIYWVISPWANSGMRSGIDPAFHNKVACFYGQKMKFANALNHSDITDCYIALLDENGKILVSQTGELTSQKKQLFLQHVD